MKAAIINQYGASEVFQIAEVATPTIGEHAVLIRVAASSINPIDWKLRKGMLRWLLPLKFPAILGYDYSGVVAKIGSKVQNLQVGDAVFGVSNQKPGGSYAEYLALDVSIVSKKPEKLTMSEAAAVPLAGLTALQSLRNLANLQAGQTVLVIGGSGGVGIYAIQIAKILGAKVTAVCSGKNIDFVRALGADDVIDYQSQSPLTEGKSYDVIFDTVATQNFLKAKPFLNQLGTYVTTMPDLVTLASAITNCFTRKKGKVVLMKANQLDLNWLALQISQNKLKPVIDRCFSLQEISKAHGYSETLRARGKIVLTIADEQ